MTILEILLLAAGALLIAASFFVKTKEDEADSDISALVREEVKKSMEAEAENMRKHVDDVVDEAVTYADEKTERALERLSNEKIMAVSEYSETVLEEINKNHKEVMFLYEMLNDKQKSLNNTVSAASEVTKEAQKTTEELKAQTANAESTVENVKSSEKKETVKTSADRSPEQPAAPVKHSSQKAINFFSGLEAQEAKATIESVKEEKPKTVRTLNWAELAVNDANEAEKKEAAKEGREPEKLVEGPRERLNREVVELAESGMDKVEIAKKLKMGVGEVGLILDLHNR
ncbi:MAG: hypothetical protein K5871_00720 [Lachnospiraceae bacterium]|nr:hypothetical protein [Lachnospiraceae bacterium]